MCEFILAQKKIIEIKTRNEMMKVEELKNNGEWYKVVGEVLVVGR
jgi:hypothetical protein